MNNKYITISQLNRYIKYKLDNDENLNEVFLKGEISNFKAHSRGHYYFTLKDENSRISAIMFASNTKKLKFIPTEGMKVLVTGKINVYEVAGSYQIYVNDMLEDGVGNLYIAYEQLKEKLTKEGLFSNEHKKQIPKIPTNIGIITAPTGAAIRDILSTIKRRFPIANTYLFPALVQGEEAKYSIVEQINRAKDYDLDVLIIGRGGGSIEDLWAFNEEIVARAIYDCPIPTISAVGHEVDFTIADFTADLRAPTPTGAAEIAVPNVSDIKVLLNNLKLRSRKVINHTIELKKQQLKEIQDRYIIKNPTNLYFAKEQQFDIILERLKTSIKDIIIDKKNMLQEKTLSYVFKDPVRIIDDKKNKYINILGKLETLSPLKTLKRGYTITRKDDKIITSCKNLKKEDKITVELSDGKINAKVV